jgi:hypothetical protein
VAFGIQACGAIERTEPYADHENGKDCLVVKLAKGE